MKKLLMLTGLVLSLVSFSCEEDFNPKADFKQKYVLWSVVNADYRYVDAIQYAVLSKLYNVDGYDPSANHEDPVLAGADVRLYADDIEYPFVQDTIKRSDTSRYNNPFIYYRSVNPVKLRFASRLLITAKLPTGEMLKSETRLPVNEGFDFSEDFDKGFTTLRRIDQSLTVWWFTQPNHLFFPRFYIRYSKKINDTLTQTRIKDIPLRYEGKDPVYPDYSIEPAVNYSYAAIDSAMALISEGDTAKSSYTILEAVFNLLEFDAPLSQYYTSINGYLDNYSVRLDEKVYSNISGGLGIFGSTYVISARFPVSKEYAKMFGYN